MASPRERAAIALLVGIPTSFAEFAERVYTSDYLSKFRPIPDDMEAITQLQTAWSERYAPMVANPIEDLLLAAEASGVRCIRRATLKDVHVATSSVDAVVLMSHWKGARLVYEDLAPNCSTEVVLERVRSAEGLLPSWLLRQDREAANLVSLLNGAITMGWEGEADLEFVDGRCAIALTLEERRRRELEHLLEGLLAPGSRLELFDGMHTKDEFERAIALDFRGHLDLTTCNSTVLANHLRHARGGRLRLVEFPEQQEFLWHAQCLTSTIDLVLSHGMDYFSARRTADKLLHEVLLEFSGQVGSGNLHAPTGNQCAKPRQRP